jgi:AcrR family transcriptional regulator
MNYAEFTKYLNLSKEDICRRTLEENRKRIRVKKEATVIKNLEKIFDATLRIANKKGFQAMTMRDLSLETAMSMGALYSYFTSKEDLLETLQSQHRAMTRQIFEKCVGEAQECSLKLRAALKAYLFMSEVMQPWFYFSFMEAKNLANPEREKTLAGDIYSDMAFVEILRQGQTEGAFAPHDPHLVAGAIKALLQDWFLKRKKYAKLNIAIDDYAKLVLDLVEGYLTRPRTPAQAPPA